MARIMEPAYRKGGASIATLEKRYATGQTFKRGDPVKHSSGELVVATASETTAVFVGVALQNVGSNPGYDAANSPTVITGQAQTVVIALCDRNNIFKANLVNNSDTPVAAVQANIGVSYGLRKIAVGQWAVDKNITATNDCVTIVDFDELDPTIVYFIWNTADTVEG